MLNDQGGRIWAQFSMAIQKLLETVGYLKEVFKEQQKVIEDNNKYIREDIEKKRQNQKTPSPPNGSYTMNTKPKTLVITPNVSVPRVLAQQSGGRRTTILPMINNAIKSKPPTIPQMQGRETDPTVISPSNITNPWMEISPSLYGIQLYV